MRITLATEKSFPRWFGDAGSFAVDEKNPRGERSAGWCGFLPEGPRQDNAHRQAHGSAAELVSRRNKPQN